ncbi:tryptophan--tRNA ligase [Chitinimonas sp. BJYL2]|uniref:tryptophan--tRNA ligase n=1 Tax=Chitinimonas sp. BJYL2 TaxID=2976696 RepID=UPI0022B5CDE6|nr:tryptophan--tRNA ligase [Chitinimonas sp. BJYL2]
MTQATQRVLTGITTTGTPHLGNYVGAIRPAIAASRAPNTESFFFLADYHALIKCDDPARVERSRMEIAAIWLAAGLDPAKVTIYRQSDVPEVTELNWLITCVTAKGLMNRAHAYKAATDINEAAGVDIDHGITMGLFCYPVLMAADILMFNAHKVPVGKDQVQHIEMARDIAQRFNHLYGAGKELFVLPEAIVDEDVPLLPGLDGRKMSKSYDNVIPLFNGGAKGLKEAVARIVTDSRLPGEPKDPDSNSLIAIFNAFATPEQTAAFRAELVGGLGWGEAKQKLLAAIEAEIGPMRAEYDALMADPARIEAAMQVGAARARAIAQPLLQELRAAVGLRSFRAPVAAKTVESAKAALPVFKQYREADGRFYFKLTAADGRVLLQSEGFEQGKDAGQWVGKLKREGAAALAGAPVTLTDSATQDEVATALAAFAEA